MNHIPIQLENIGKCYQIKRGQRYGTLKEAINRIIVPSRFRKTRQDTAFKEDINTLWALKDISCRINQGEIVGLVGRNGAGKSTLLKIIAGITTPTCGKAIIEGRIGCLLEVGAGFHPFLSGRENIFLSGSILGLSRAEIKNKFDEIVAFAEVENFIDTQVKYYSSGMYARLAFAVAAHMVVDILIVDEVLSVGDIAFQKKCLGKIDDVASDGRTVLFVSHNMAAIQRLCNRGLLIHDGKIIMDAKIDAIVSQYLNNYCNIPSKRSWDDSDAPGDDHVQLRSIRVINDKNENVQTIDIRESVRIEIIYRIKKKHQQPSLIIHFINEQWLHLFSSHDFHQKLISPNKSDHEICKTCYIPGNFFNQGRIYIHLEIVSLFPKKNHVSLKEIVTFETIDQRELAEMKGPFGTQWPGVIRPALKWKACKLNSR
jgi:lipopolysaccharide transport system ATP-binding protein